MYLKPSKNKCTGWLCFCYRRYWHWYLLSIDRYQNFKYRTTLMHRLKLQFYMNFPLPLELNTQNNWTKSKCNFLRMLHPLIGLVQGLSFLSSDKSEARSLLILVWTRLVYFDPTLITVLKLVPGLHSLTVCRPVEFDDMDRPGTGWAGTAIGKGLMLCSVCPWESKLGAGNYVFYFNLSRSIGQAGRFYDLTQIKLNNLSYQSDKYQKTYVPH